MNNRLLLAFALFFFVVTAHAAPVPPATYKDGSIVSGYTRANFDPSARVTPLPFNLLFLGTADLTLNPPVADPNDYSDPLVALGAVDDFSPTEKWVTDPPAAARYVGYATYDAALHAWRLFQSNAGAPLGALDLVNREGVVLKVEHGLKRAEILVGELKIKAGFDAIEEIPDSAPAAAAEKPQEQVPAASSYTASLSVDDVSDHQCHRHDRCRSAAHR